MAKNGAEPPDPLEDLDRAITTLEKTEWDDDDEPITNHHIIFNVGDTGKFSPMTPAQADRVPRVEVESSSPPSKLSPLALGWLAVRRMPPWGVVLVVLALTAAYVALRLR
jgi:hypothetical protein